MQFFSVLWDIDIHIEMLHNQKQDQSLIVKFKQVSILNLPYKLVSLILGPSFVH